MTVLLQRSLLAAALALITWMFVVQAWMVDDAYITLRTVDNFVRGLGLGWNPDERVQAFTHPLWMFCLSALYFFTREGFLTTLALSYVLLLALIATVWSPLRREGPGKPLLFVGMLVASKAFFDFTSSGLENPLTVLLVAFFYRTWLSPAPQDDGARLRRFGRLLFIAALAFFNRIDTLLLYAPALAWETVEVVRLTGRRAFAPLLVGTLPATGWFSFAIVYFGAPFPNTAYAKALDNGVGFAAFFRQGIEYFVNGLEWDPATHVIMILALALALRSRQRAPIVACLGLLLYLTYTLTIGAGGTHMSGRFFSGPLVLGALVVLATLPSRRAAAGVAVAVAILAVLSPGAPVLSAGSRRTLGNEGKGRAGIIDTRWFVHREGAALRKWKKGISWPNHGWYDQGLKFRVEKEKVKVGGASGGLPIGYFSYAAGPDKFIIDVLGLTDPLLARLPMKKGWRWWGGHFLRDIPAGYVESVRDDDNQIVDPDLHAYYDEIRRITRGPIFSLARFRAIYELHTGELDPLVAAYASRSGSRQERGLGGAVQHPALR